MVIDLGEDVDDTDRAAADLGEHEEVDATLLLLRGKFVLTSGGVDGIMVALLCLVGEDRVVVAFSLVSVPVSLW